MASCGPRQTAAAAAAAAVAAAAAAIRWCYNFLLFRICSCLFPFSSVNPPQTNHSTSFCFCCCCCCCCCCRSHSAHRAILLFAVFLLPFSSLSFCYLFHFLMHTHTAEAPNKGCNAACSKCSGNSRSSNCNSNSNSNSSSITGHLYFLDSICCF